MPFVVDSQDGWVRLSVWRRDSRRDVFVTAAVARRLADAVNNTDIVDGGTLATETAADDAEITVRERDNQRELTVAQKLRRGRQVVCLDSFEETVAGGLRDAAKVADNDEVDSEPTAGGEPA